MRSRYGPQLDRKIRRQKDDCRIQSHISGIQQTTVAGTEERPLFSVRQVSTAARRARTRKSLARS